MNWDWRNDGKDHINIFSRGQTDLGRWLSNFSPMPDHGPIKTPYSNFHTIEGYWYWLGIRDERLRTCDGQTAKHIGKYFDGDIKMLPIQEFRNLICDAITYKITRSKLLSAALRDSSLPLAHYYVFKGRMQPAGYKWLVDHIENVRKQLQESKDA